jgi:hypothetical protein
MALALPTSWSLFYVGNVIVPAFPTILLVLDVGRGDFVLVLQDSIFPCSLVLWETVLLAEVNFFTWRNRQVTQHNQD